MPNTSLSPSVGSFRSGMVSTIRPQLFRLPSPVESPFQSTRLQKLPLPCTGTRHRTNGSDCYRCNRIYIISGRRRCRHSLYHRRLLSYGSFPLYTTPVTVDDKSDFRAITVINPRHYSLPIISPPTIRAINSTVNIQPNGNP